MHERPTTVSKLSNDDFLNAFNSVLNVENLCQFVPKKSEEQSIEGKVFDPQKISIQKKYSTELRSKNRMILIQQFPYETSQAKRANEIDPYTETELKIGKPAVYLYPTQDQRIAVKLKIDGRITISDPPYQNRWDVWSTKNSLIDGKYDYLFYEAAVQNIPVPTKGWVVAHANLESWLDRFLPQLGLNGKETSQFKEYWLAHIPVSKFVVIKVISPEFLNQRVRLEISPKPQTLIRVILHFQNSDSAFSIPEPVISPLQRNGFTVVEWGGILAASEVIH
jgi:hypothetical protein